MLYSLFERNFIFIDVMNFDVNILIVILLIAIFIVRKNDKKDT